MGRTVAELTSSLTTGELAHWFAFNNLRPIRTDLIDWNFAQLCSLVCTAAGVKKISGGKFSMDDFMLFQRRPEAENPAAVFRAGFAHRIKKAPK